jgi:hypothetical protein
MGTPSWWQAPCSKSTLPPNATDKHPRLLPGRWLINWCISWCFNRFFRHSLRGYDGAVNVQAIWCPLKLTTLFQSLDGRWLFLFAESSCWSCLLGINVKAEVRSTSTSYCQSLEISWYVLVSLCCDEAFQLVEEIFLCIAVMCTWKTTICRSSGFES